MLLLTSVVSTVPGTVARYHAGDEGAGACCHADELFGRSAPFAPGLAEGFASTVGGGTYGTGLNTAGLNSSEDTVAPDSWTSAMSCMSQPDERTIGTGSALGAAAERAWVDTRDAIAMTKAAAERVRERGDMSGTLYSRFGGNSRSCQVIRS